MSSLAEFQHVGFQDVFSIGAWMSIVPTYL